MKVKEVILEPLKEKDKEQFIIENQRAFKYGALEEFGVRDNHIDLKGEIISRETIEKSLSGSGSEAFWIIADGKEAGGLILSVDKETCINHLDILFVKPEAHSKGIGYGAWKAVEKMYPETKIWETYTPYFEKRNIHFYVNKCGFQIVEFFNEYNRDPNFTEDESEGPDEMFRFIKIMKQ